MAAVLENHFHEPTELVQSAFARMQDVPRFFSHDEWDVLAMYEGPLVSGNAEGPVLQDLANDEA